MHAYYAANEPYEPWEGLSRTSDEYKALKADRADNLWRALEKIIPDVRPVPNACLLSLTASFPSCVAVGPPRTPALRSRVPACNLLPSSLSSQQVRSRVITELTASPLTHERFLRRTRGSYGPPLFHGAETIPCAPLLGCCLTCTGPTSLTIPHLTSFVCEQLHATACPLRGMRHRTGSIGKATHKSAYMCMLRYAATPIPGLLHCGDSTFPGIGVPSAAASGMNAANTLATPWQQLEMMDELDSKGQLNP